MQGIYRHLCRLQAAKLQTYEDVLTTELDKATKRMQQFPENTFLINEEVHDAPVLQIYRKKNWQFRRQAIVSDGNHRSIQVCRKFFRTVPERGSSARINVLHYQAGN